MDSDLIRNPWCQVLELERPCFIGRKVLVFGRCWAVHFNDGPRNGGVISIRHCAADPPRLLIRHGSLLARQGSRNQTKNESTDKLTGAHVNGQSSLQQMRQAMSRAQAFAI